MRFWGQVATNLRFSTASSVRTEGRVTTSSSRVSLIQVALGMELVGRPSRSSLFSIELFSGGNVSLLFPPFLTRTYNVRTAMLENG